LAVFRELKRSASFILRHKIGKNSFTRNRKLTFDKVMTMILKKSNKSLQNSLNDMLLDLNEDSSITNSAYIQARAKLKETAFKEYFDLSVNSFYSDGDFSTFKGFRILAVDGSNVILPNSEDIKQEFNPTIAKCQIKEYQKEVIQARVSCLYDVINHIVIDASINNKVNSKDNNLKAYGERALAFKHLEYCTKDDLAIFDRGYPSYELFAKYGQKSNFICRIKKTSFKEAKALFNPHSKYKDIIVEITAPKPIKSSLKKSGLPTKMKIRFIQIILDNGTVEVLATNILDHNVLEYNDFKELYAKRWGIESYYDLIKNRLSLENFTGKSLLSIKQDFWATLFLTNFEALLTYELNQELKEKKSDNRYEQKINKAVSFNLIKMKLFDLLYKDIPVDTTLQRLEKLLIQNTILIRPNRKTKPRLDKQRQKSTIANNSINYAKRKKKNVGN